MTRREWDELPAGVRRAIEAECGPVTAAVSPDAGRNSDVSATLRTSGGHAVFCKGVQLDSRRARMHAHEARVNPYLPAVAPRLLWQTEADGWLLLGFECVPGQHASLAPGSTDLELVADAVRVIGDKLTPCPLDVPSLAEQWARLAAWRRLAVDEHADLDGWARDNVHELIEWEYRAFELIDGDSLAHTDLHPLNVLVADEARVIDWAWSRRAAAWVDPAVLVLRLIDEGHTPREAERWAESVPAWHTATDEARTAFAVALLGVWTYMHRADPAPHRAPLVKVAHAWVDYRLNGSPVTA